MPWSPLSCLRKPPRPAESPPPSPRAGASALASERPSPTVVSTLASALPRRNSAAGERPETSASSRADTPSRPPRASAPSSSNPASTLTAEQTALIGVARWPDPKHNRENTPAQQQYGRAFSAESARLGGLIGSGEIKDLDHLWKACRDWRAGRARPNGADAVKEMSAPRTKEDGPGINKTPVHGQYEFVHDRMKALSSPVAMDEYGEEAEPGDAVAFMMRTHKSSTLIDGKPTDLSTVQVYSDQNDNMRAKAIWGFDVPVVGQITHPPIGSIPAVLKEAGSVFKAVQAPGLDKDQKLAGLARMHWLLAQAMPDHRGSAAKAEMAVRATAHALNMELPPFKHGVQPDIESFLRTEADFVAQYPRLLDHPEPLPDPANSPRG